MILRCDMQHVNVNVTFNSAPFMMAGFCFRARSKVTPCSKPTPMIPLKQQCWRNSYFDSLEKHSQLKIARKYFSRWTKIKQGVEALDRLCILLCHSWKIFSFAKSLTWTSKLIQRFNILSRFLQDEKKEVNGIEDAEAALHDADPSDQKQSFPIYPNGEKIFFNQRQCLTIILFQSSMATCIRLIQMAITIISITTTVHHRVRLKCDVANASSTLETLINSRAQLKRRLTIRTMTTPLTQDDSIRAIKTDGRPTVIAMESFTEFIWIKT